MIETAVMLDVVEKKNKNYFWRDKSTYYCQHW